MIKILAFMSMAALIVVSQMIEDYLVLTGELPGPFPEMLRIRALLLLSMSIGAFREYVKLVRGTSG